MLAYLDRCPGLHRFAGRGFADRGGASLPTLPRPLRRGARRWDRRHRRPPPAGAVLARDGVLAMAVPAMEPPHDVHARRPGQDPGLHSAGEPAG